MCFLFLSLWPTFCHLLLLVFFLLDGKSQFVLGYSYTYLLGRRTFSRITQIREIKDSTQAGCHQIQVLLNTASTFPNLSRRTHLLLRSKRFAKSRVEQQAQLPSPVCEFHSFLTISGSLGWLQLSSQLAHRNKCKRHTHNCSEMWSCVKLTVSQIWTSSS